LLINRAKNLKAGKLCNVYCVVFIRNNAKGKDLCFWAKIVNYTWAIGVWATLRTQKRATRNIPGCRDRSRQFYKGYTGNAQYDHVEAHFRILKGLGSALCTSSQMPTKLLGPIIYRV
jgi:hypothetical protein